MVMLALDTSSPATSIALLDGDAVLAHHVHVDSRNHAEVLAVMVEDALRAAGHPRVTSVSCGVGPGAYTGLRVGVSSAQAYGLGWDVPVYGVCSLDAMALAARQLGSEPFACAIDARRREVYWAQYGPSGERVQGPFVAKPDEIPSPTRALQWFGEIAVAYSEVLNSAKAEAVRHPDARDVARFALQQLSLGEQIDLTPVELSTHGQDSGATSAALRGAALLQPLPLYVRRPDAKEPAK